MSDDLFDKLDSLNKYEAEIAQLKRDQHFTAAVAAMQGMLQAGARVSAPDPYVVTSAVEYADALLARLAKGGDK